MGKYKLDSTSCPKCEAELDTEQGVRMHHTRKHKEKLPNRVCNDCGSEFYDSDSQRNLCDECASDYRYTETPEEIDENRWKSMSAHQRWYYNNKEKEKDRVKKNKNNRKDYVANKYIINKSCNRCGFDDERALEFHHTDENKLDESLMTMAKNMRSKELIEKEFNRGELICANCHLINHHPNRLKQYR